VNDLSRYVLYFLLGGSIVSFSTYLGSQGKSFLAAMASTFYASGGGATTVDYAKNLLWFVPPWTVYVVAMIMGIPRLGFWPAMIGSLVLYMGCIGLVKMVLR
jgi:hypothetical protein